MINIGIEGRNIEDRYWLVFIIDILVVNILNNIKMMKWRYFGTNRNDKYKK